MSCPLRSSLLPSPFWYTSSSPGWCRSWLSNITSVYSSVVTLPDHLGGGEGGTGWLVWPCRRHATRRVLCRLDGGAYGCPDPVSLPGRAPRQRVTGAVYSRHRSARVDHLA